MEVFKSLVGTEESDVLFAELKEIRDYKSGGRWRAAFSDAPGELTLEGSSVPSSSRQWLPHVRELRDRLTEIVETRP